MAPPLLPDASVGRRSAAQSLPCIKRKCASDDATSAFPRAKGIPAAFASIRVSAPHLGGSRRSRGLETVRGVRTTKSPARTELQSGLHLYLKQINETALLTADEEKRLGWNIINDNCSASRERMVRSNLRLVV